MHVLAGVCVMRCLRSVLACLFLASATIASAADLERPTSGQLATAPDDWIVTVRAKAIASPEYPGSKDYSFFGYPALSLRKASSPATFSAPDDNVSLALFDRGWLKAGPVGKFVSARRASEHSELFGIHNVGWTVELGGFVEIWPSDRFRTRFEVRQGIRGHEDIVGTVAADWVQPLGNWTFSIGPRVNIVGNRFADRYFSISPIEAAFNGRVTPFKARGGFESIGATGAATYQWSPAWGTTAYVRYERLIGDAGRSPMSSVLGTRNQWTVGGNISYSFAMKPLVDWF